VNPGKQLHDLQEIDLDLGKKTEMLSQVERQLSHNETLAEAKTELEDKRRQLAELEKNQKAVEWNTEDLLAKAKPLQEKLYGGSVKNPKELTGLKQQMERLQNQIRGEEDSTLAIMGQVEAMRQGIATQVTRVAKLEEEWREKREALLAEQANLATAIDAARKKRAEIVGAIDSANLQIYEVVRARKQGYAVAKIGQGRCQGCRITLSVSEVARARIGELVQCDSCSRILYLG